jgi:hypothetical protein
VVPNVTATHQHSSTCTYLGVDYDARTHRGPSPYCGSPTNGYSSYCEEHYPVVYAVGSGLRKRHKDIRVAEAVHTIESLFHEVVAELESEGELTLD